MLIFTVAVSFIIAVLSGLGVGGGGLFVIYLALFTDVPQLAAQGINLVFFLFCAGASVAVHITKRKILFSAVAIMALSGLVGALLGSLISSRIDQDLLRKIFGAMLTLTGIISLRSSFVKTDEKKDQKN